jgi:pyrimidine operon attenuation protein/uracil phosphoribosyltransferase
MAEGWVRARTLLDGGEMRRVIARLAAEIVERNRGVEDLLLIGIRTRGVPLAEALADAIEKREGQRPALGVLDITLYRDDLSTIAPHPVIKATHLPGAIDNRTVVLCDDVLYTGRTVRAALGALVDFGRPRRVELAVLVDRGLRELPIQADFVGRAVATSPDELVDVHFPSTDGEERVEVLVRAT